MRRVIQRTVTTTKIVSLTITHSESEEAVEYTLIDNPIASAPDRPETDRIEIDQAASEPATSSTSEPDAPDKA